MRYGHWILVVGTEVLYSGAQGIRGGLVRTLLLLAEVGVGQRRRFCP